MAGKILTAEQIKERDTTEVVKFIRQIVSAAKKDKIYLGHYSHHFENGQWSITVESSNSGYKYGFSEDIADIISKNARVTIIEKQEHKGSFDWASDTYIKDSSSVTFKF